MCVFSGRSARWSACEADACLQSSESLILGEIAELKKQIAELKDLLLQKQAI